MNWQDISPFLWGFCMLLVAVFLTNYKHTIKQKPLKSLYCLIPAFIITVLHHLNCMFIIHYEHGKVVTGFFSAVLLIIITAIIVFKSKNASAPK